MQKWYRMLARDCQPIETGMPAVHASGVLATRLPILKHGLQPQPLGMFRVLNWFVRSRFCFFQQTSDSNNLRSGLQTLWRLRAKTGIKWSNSFKTCLDEFEWSKYIWIEGIGFLFLYEYTTCSIFQCIIRVEIDIVFKRYKQHYS